MTGGHLKDLKAEGQGIFEMNYLVQLVWLQRGGTQLIIQMGIMAHTKLIGQPDLREKFKPFTPNTLAHHGQTNAFSAYGRDLGEGHRPKRLWTHSFRSKMSKLLLIKNFK